MQALGAALQQWLVPAADLAAPGARGVRPADRAGPGHGALGVVGQRVRGRRLVVRGVLPAVRVRARRRGPVLGRRADPAAPVAGGEPLAARGLPGAARPGARAGPGRVRQRLALLVPGRRGVAAALGDHEGRAGAVGRPRPGPPPARAAALAAGAHAGHARGAADLHARHRPARPRHDDLAGRDRRGPAVVRVRAGGPARAPLDRGRHRGRDPRRRRLLPAEPDRRVPRPRAAPTRSGPPTRHARRCTRSPTAGCSGRASARAGRSGATCPTPTTTSSSRSSARSSGSSGRSP